MMVVLIGADEGDIELGADVVSVLARLGVTSVSLLRDLQTVGIVLEGWLFDPARSAGAVTSAIGVGGRSRSLHPVLHMAVSTAAHEGGRDVEKVS
jgi:hypothetical protein